MKYVLLFSGNVSVFGDNFRGLHPGVFDHDWADFRKQTPGQGDRVAEVRRFRHSAAKGTILNARPTPRALPANILCHLGRLLGAPEHGVQENQASVIVSRVLDCKSTVHTVSKVSRLVFCIV